MCVGFDELLVREAYHPHLHVGCPLLGSGNAGVYMLADPPDTIARRYRYVMGTILRHGSEEQREKWLTKIAGGLKLQAFGVSEPNNGTDTLSLETKAVRADDGTGDYIVNGQKMWTSRAKQ